MEEIFYLFLFGTIGALLKEILEDNKLTMPKFENGEMFLGFIGSCVVGGITGYLVDNNPTTALLAGFSGKTIIENLILKKEKTQTTGQNTTEAIIKIVAKQEGVDPEICIKVAKCESNLSPSAINTNKDGSRDRGLFQINDKWHPEISDTDCFDIIESTKFFCKAYKAGNLSWWDASKKCWSA